MTQRLPAIKPSHYANWSWLSQKAFDKLLYRPQYITYQMIEDVTGVKESTLRYFVKGKIKDLKASDAVRVLDYFEEIESKH